MECKWSKRLSKNTRNPGRVVSIFRNSLDSVYPWFIASDAIARTVLSSRSRKVCVTPTFVLLAGFTGRSGYFLATRLAKISLLEIARARGLCDRPRHRTTYRQEEILSSRRRDDRNRPVYAPLSTRASSSPTFRVSFVHRFVHSWSNKTERTGRVECADREREIPAGRF